MSKVMPSSELLQFIQDRLDTREWWLLPVATPAAAQLADEIIARHYTGDNQVLCDFAFIPNQVADAPFLILMLASKSCMSAEQAQELLHLPSAPAEDRDVLVHSSTPIGVMMWMSRVFH